MRQSLATFVLVGLMGMTVSCCRDQSRADSKAAQPLAGYDASPRKEIIGQHVLSAQLAPHDEVESKTTFAPTEPIPASLYLTSPSYVGPRRIFAFLVSEEAVVEEQSIGLSASDDRRELDFHFVKTPRPLGCYQIRFIEVTRSTAKPALIARLFLNVE